MTPDPMHDDDPAPDVVAINTQYDMFADDTPLACGIEDPESCESCQ